MDKFKNRAYNKADAKEQAECMKETMKGIVLDGEATGNMGAATYPTYGADRRLACEGANTMEENAEIEKEGY